MVSRDREGGEGGGGSAPPVAGRARPGRGARGGPPRPSTRHPAGAAAEPGPPPPPAPHLRPPRVRAGDTIYGDLSALRRRAWHADAGLALARIHPGDVESLAHHFGHAGPAHRSEERR